MNTPEPTQLPKDRFGLISRSAALDAGFSDNDIAAACRRGELTRVARGYFALPDLALSDDRTPQERHRLTAIATVQSLGQRGHVLSHESAATLHGLTMLKPALDRVHYTIGNASGARRTAGRHAHVGPLSKSDVVLVDGIRVTSLQRTAVDVACTSALGFAGALAIFDAALRRGAEHDGLAYSLEATRRNGVGQSRRALRLADGRADGPGESWSRAQIIVAGLPTPRLQHEFHDSRGLIGVTDLDWQGVLAGEFDGMVKYQKYLRPGESALDAMRREKEREDRLRRANVMVIRWTWKDLERRRVAEFVRGWLGHLGVIDRFG